MTFPELRSTSSFPLPQRAGIRIFRRFGRAGVGVFREIGLRVFFLRDTLRGLSDPATYLPLTMRQMRGIGVDSIPLVVIVAGFIGAVVAVQSYYQLFAGVQRSVLGLIVRQMIVLELGPLLTGLVLTGRVGARMTAEIGTMRVTEQIDALETLAYDPVAYLVVPRVLAALVMLPVLTVIANAVGLGSAFLVSVAATEVRAAEFTEGLRFGFDTFQIVYSLIKATFFGVAIAFFCTYEGYTTGAGAEGVGRSTASAVVISSVAILILDALTALLLARYLQG